jgi:hypothetical protein
LVALRIKPKVYSLAEATTQNSLGNKDNLTI